LSTPFTQNWEAKVATLHGGVALLCVASAAL